MVNIENAIEAILFVYGEAISPKELAEVLGEPEILVMDVLQKMKDKRTDAGIQLIFLEGNVQFRTNPQYAQFVEKLLETNLKPQVLSNAAIETLSVVAYNQPVTRGEIEAVRGVNCDYTVNTLLQKGLIYVCGRKETVGKPMQYATSEEFLRHFNIASIDELPKIETDEEQENITT